MLTEDGVFQASSSQFRLEKQALKTLTYCKHTQRMTTVLNQNTEMSKE